MITCIGFIACGGNGNGTTLPPSKKETPTPPEEATMPSPSGGFTWDDIPVYPDAKQVQKGSWLIPPAEGEYSKVEWLYYETSDSVDTVSSFYKGQMPNNRWKEMGWMETPEMNWGMYSKNNEHDAAMVWMGLDEDRTYIALMRANK